MYPLFLAYEYLIRRPINLLGAFGVMVAVAALVIVGSVFSGFIHDVRAHVRGVSPAMSYVDGSLEKSFEELESLLTEDEGVRAVAPRLVWHALLYPERAQEKRRILNNAERPVARTDYVRLIGVDFARERRVTAIDEWLADVRKELRPDQPENPFSVDPKRLDDGGGDFALSPPGILIGRRRMENFRLALSTKRGRFLEVGESIDLISAQTDQDAADEGGVRLVKRRFAMSGSYYAGRRNHEFEATTAFVDIEELRIIFGFNPMDDEPDVFNEVAIAVHDEARMDAIAERLNAKLRTKGYKGEVLTWVERNQRFLQAVEIEHSVMKIVLFVFMVVASFLIFALLSVMVAKKTKDIGILSALGATRRGVLTIFLIDGIAISAIGTAAGLLLGWLVCANLDAINDTMISWFGAGIFPVAIYGLNKIPVQMEALWLAQISVGAITIAFLFSLLPALRASRLDPVRAFRND